MALVKVTDNPKITDTVLFTLNTTGDDGSAVNPYKINQVFIYYIERSYTATNNKKLDVNLITEETVNLFRNAITVAVFGTDLFPAWLSSDTDNAFLAKEDFDEDGNPQVGVFSLEWTPDLKQSREGDYVICWTWTPIAAGDSISAVLPFILYGDTSHTTTIPSHFTKPDKYETLLERYTPEMFKMVLGTCDVSPDVLDRTNLSIAKGFTTLENMANQIVDLIDANAVAENLLPYLANFFCWRLKSLDSQLWRRQIKQAVPLYKRKGTLGGLQEALAEADIDLLSFTQLWQTVSKATWQEAFIVEAAQLEDFSVTFYLDKLAILDSPIDTQNFQLFIRLEGTDTYIELSMDYVYFTNVDGVTIMSWVGDNLSVSPVSLREGDVVRIVYKIAEPADQDVEDYIRTLPLADDRDEITVTYPQKNWNVRLIEETDAYFSTICPDRHPFHDDVIYGKVRTEFPYSENVYNMEEYNGSTRDSADPCDLDKDFLDSCSCCLSSKFNVSLSIENLTPDRLSEAREIIKDFVPFHAIPHQISYIGKIEDFVLSPVEVIEVLATFRHIDNMIMTQFHFNRLIEEGSSDAAELKRNMLATANVVANPSGTGQNLAIAMFSPGVQFGTLGIDDDDNILEILSGANAGEYQVDVTSGEQFVVDLIQGAPDTIPEPLDATGFPFRLSNIMYDQSSASVYQDDLFVFADSNVKFANLATQAGWKIVVTSGIFAGTYPIADVQTDNTVVVTGWPAATNALGLSYQLQTSTSAVVTSSNAGQMSVTRRGRVEIDLVVEELGIQQDDYVLFGSNQYRITNHVRDSVDKLYIDSYTGGSVVGIATIYVYRRLLDNVTGYLSYRGMKLTGAVPTVDDTLENDMFLDNYLILIGTDYYQIASVVGSVMTLVGPMLTWTLAGTAVNYSIVQFVKTSAIETQDGTSFDRLDRRATELLVIETETAMPMSFMAGMLNDINRGQNGWKDSVANQESITIDIEYR